MEPKFSTHLLDEVSHRKREELEAERLKIVQEIFTALETLSEQVSFQEAYLFGSVIRPYAFSKHSDLDIGFVGLSDADFFRAAAFLSRETGREIDLLQLEHHRLGQKIKNEGLSWKKKSLLF
jgi:predicted nucleotidyltransferase